MSRLNPIKAVKQGMKDKIDGITHGLVVKCKIAAGIVAAIIAVQICTPVVKFCTSIKKFVQTKKVSSKNLLDINSKDFGKNKEIPMNLIECLAELNRNNNHLPV